MSRLKFILLLAATLMINSIFAQELSMGEYATMISGAPATNGQATQDHLFTRCEYSGQMYDDKVSFQDGTPQTIWFYLDDDEIYLNEAVQSLTPIPYNAAGDLYNEITYNSFQCDLYLPESIELISLLDEDENEIYYLQGDRMPSTTVINWNEKGTKIIDGMNYRCYTITCYNPNSFGTHLSARNATKYRQQGALKKDSSLFGLYLRNNNQSELEGRLDQDLIIANQIFTMRETYIAHWDSNQSVFFFGTGGNNASQRFMRYNRVELYGSKGFDTEVSEDYLLMPDTAVMHGTTIVIPVSLTNSQSITAFQTDIYLPQGFTLLKEDGEYMVELSDRKARDHVIMANDSEDGSVRVLSFSPGLRSFRGNDGELFYMTIMVPDNGDGIYPIQIKNTRLTTIDEQEIQIPDITGYVTVNSYLAGDVNNSGTITITDAVVAARYILNYNPSPFIFGAADMNNDGIITITDVVMIAHLVLTTEINAPQSDIDILSTNDNMDGWMSVPDNSCHRTAEITLDNELEYSAFQLDLQLDNNMVVNDFAMAGRASGLNLEFYQLDNGKIRLVGYSTSLNPINGNKGTVLSFDVVGTGVIYVDNIELVTTQGEAVHPYDFIIATTQAINVDELQSKVNIYNNGHDIIIDTPADQIVSISDITGRTWQAYASAGRTIIPIQHAGVYIVSAAGQTMKLMMK